METSTIRGCFCSARSTLIIVWSTPVEAWSTTTTAGCVLPLPWYSLIPFPTFFLRSVLQAYTLCNGSNSCELLSSFSVLLEYYFVRVPFLPAIVNNVVEKSNCSTFLSFPQKQPASISCRTTRICLDYRPLHRLGKCKGNRGTIFVSYIKFWNKLIV